jgi:hypothetical protein
MHVGKTLIWISTAENLNCPTNVDGSLPYRMPAISAMLFMRTHIKFHISYDTFSNDLLKGFV